MNTYMDTILRALNVHYQTLGMTKEDIAQRIGNVILMMSSIFVSWRHLKGRHVSINYFAGRWNGVLRVPPENPILRLMATGRSSY